eukprot:scaffold1788_cov84-Phaeocystis_antarctica.AAC.1
MVPNHPLSHDLKPQQPTNRELNVVYFHRSRCLTSLNRSSAFLWKAQRKRRCAPCPRAKRRPQAPLARHPFASHGPKRVRVTKLVHPTPSPAGSFSAQRATRLSQHF